MSVQDILSNSARRRAHQAFTVVAICLLAFLYFGWSQLQVQETQRQNHQLIAAIQETSRVLLECNTPSQPGDVHECFESARGRERQALSVAADLAEQSREALRDTLLCVLLEGPENRTVQTIKECEVRSQTRGGERR